MMGYENLTAGPAIWTQYRDQFPITEKLTYFNHAAVSPLCKRAADAINRITGDILLYGSLHYDQWLDAYEGLRVAAATLINAHRDEIAIVKNTSEGIATVAIGIQWRAGDRVVAFEEEFPANYYPWKRLETKGVHIEWLSCTATLDQIDHATRGARLLAISYVQYLSGYRADIEAIGEICNRHGCLFFLDAIQGMGAFPIDVRRARIHALAADGHKWMLGPEGCGVLYVQKDVQDSIEPVEFGYTNVARHTDYSSRNMDLRSDAGRYECGTLNTIGIFGLRAALQFLLDVGIDRIGPQVQSRGDEIANGARERDYKVLGPWRTPSTGAGIVSFRKEGVDSRVIVKQLREAGFATAARSGWVRTSPHFYISPEDVKRLIDVL